MPYFARSYKFHFPTQNTLDTFSTFIILLVRSSSEWDYFFEDTDRKATNLDLVCVCFIGLFLPMRWVHSFLFRNHFHGSNSPHCSIIADESYEVVCCISCMSHYYSWCAHSKCLYCPTTKGCKLLVNGRMAQTVGLIWRTYKNQIQLKQLSMLLPIR